MTLTSRILTWDFLSQVYGLIYHLNSVFIIVKIVWFLSLLAEFIQQYQSYTVFS